MKPNVLRRKLESGEPTVSTHIHSTWPSVIEAIGHAGVYDYVEFVAEYGPSDLHDLDNMARAAELFDMGIMIKVDQSHQAYLARSALLDQDSEACCLRTQDPLRMCASRS